MGWDILLFDLDGTLTDSGPGIMHAAKTALQSFGIDGLSEQELRYFVGPPLWRVVRQVSAGGTDLQRPSTGSGNTTA